MQPISSTQIPLSAQASVIRTSDQTAAFERMHKFGRLHFSSNQNSGLIRPRFSTLLAGPTGSGKSKLCHDVATALGAHYHRLPAGEWIPVGAKGTATCDELMRLVLTHPRLVLHVDELDKFQPQFQNEWTRSIANSIFDVLEGVLQWSPAALKKHGADKLKNLARGIWCVGSGTWQELFTEERDHRTLGFASASAAVQPKTAIQDRIHERGIIPAELLARFSSEIQILRYPDVAEAIQMLDCDTWPDRAEKVGYPLAKRLGNLLPRAGFRALESVIAEIRMREDDLIPAQKSQIATKSVTKSRKKPTRPAGTPKQTVCHADLADYCDEIANLPAPSESELEKLCAEAGIRLPFDNFDTDDIEPVSVEQSALASSYCCVVKREPELCFDGCFFMRVEKLAKKFGHTNKEVLEHLDQASLWDYTASELSCISGLRPPGVVRDRDGTPWLAVSAASPATSCVPLKNSVSFEPWLELNSETVGQLAEVETLLPQFADACFHDAIITAYKLGGNPAGWMTAYTEEQAIAMLSPSGSRLRHTHAWGYRWVGPMTDYPRAQNCLKQAAKWLSRMGFSPCAVTVHCVGDPRVHTDAYADCTDIEEVHVILNFVPISPQDLPCLDIYVLHFSEIDPDQLDQKKRRAAKLGQAILRAWANAWIHFVDTIIEKPWNQRLFT